MQNNCGTNGKVQRIFHCEEGESAAPHVVPKGMLLCSLLVSSIVLLKPYREIATPLCSSQ